MLGTFKSNQKSLKTKACKCQICKLACDDTVPAGFCLLFSLSTQVSHKGIAFSDATAFVFTVHGGYSSWGSWGACSVQCGGGSRSRSRMCTNPPPQYGGNDCSVLGPSSEQEDCNTNNCPSKMENWIFSKLWRIRFLWNPNVYATPRLDTAISHFFGLNYSQISNRQLNLWKTWLCLNT